jgi:hypothetical protein
MPITGSASHVRRKGYRYRDTLPDRSPSRGLALRWHNLIVSGVHQGGADDFLPGAAFSNASGRKAGKPNIEMSEV